MNRHIIKPHFSKMLDTQDRVTFMSQPYWIEVKVEVDIEAEVDLNLRLK